MWFYLKNWLSCLKSAVLLIYWPFNYLIVVVVSLTFIWFLDLTFIWKVILSLFVSVWAYVGFIFYMPIGLLALYKCICAIKVSICRFIISLSLMQFSNCCLFYFVSALYLSALVGAFYTWYKCADWHQKARRKTIIEKDNSHRKRKCDALKLGFKFFDLFSILFLILFLYIYALFIYLVIY